MSRGIIGSARVFVTAVVLIVAVCAPARANVITFGTQNVDHLIAAMSQTEGLFTYQATAGQGWEITNSYGNPPATLTTFFNGEPALVGDTVEIRRTGGGTFNFNSVDFRTINSSGSDRVAITGLLGAVPAGTLTLATSTTSYQTVPSGFAGSPIDLLRVQVTFDGNNALLMDNFVLTVPEPTTVGLAGAAGAAMFCRRVSRRAARVVRR
jgi:hypothetical protein